jgi:hypothetical protein
LVFEKVIFDEVSDSLQEEVCMPETRFKSWTIFGIQILFQQKIKNRKFSFWNTFPFSRLPVNTLSGFWIFLTTCFRTFHSVPRCKLIYLQLKIILF